MKPGAKTESGRDGTRRETVRLEIPVAEIEPDADNRVISESGDDFESLMDSVRVMDILVPLQVQRRADGKYRLIDGERRWRAAVRIGRTSVPCDVWPETSHPRDVVVAGVVINEQRQAHSCVAVARRLRAVKNQFAESQEQVAVIPAFQN